MSGRMLFTFIFSLTAFSILFISLFWHRFRLEERYEELENLATITEMEDQAMTPNTLNYMVSGYIIVFITITVYVFSILIRVKNTQKKIASAKKKNSPENK